ncbi:hypothetical protein BKA62DRAFT_710544 [Auriculariales sp. MPI-PUGE-AT-0066]|nr:hypothetical protein BKA62DRAFT_710544 [Auriculariales sp. MPI-PUGE-AT-0066]
MSSNTTERPSAPEGFIRDINPRGEGAFQPSESGILDTSRVDPLNRKTEAEEWSATKTPAGAAGTGTWTETATNAASTAGGVAYNAATSAATVATGAAKMAYGTAVGDEQLKKDGSTQVWGKPEE